MSHIEQQYLDLGKKILTEGKIRKDRTGVGTIGLFGAQIRCNLTKGEFPLLTTKKVFFKPMVAELIWFLEGSTDNNRLHELGAKIWDQWAIENGSLGKIYGHQWIKWEETKIISVDEWDLNYKEYQEKGYIYFDEFYTTSSNPHGTKIILIKRHNQIAELIHNLKTKPFSRRHVISAWNVADLPDESKSPQQNVLDDKMSLAPCHCLFQFHVEEMTSVERLNEYYRRGVKTDMSHFCLQGQCCDTLMEELDKLNIPRLQLNCQLYQRSADFPVGVPFNIASYALLTMMIAQTVNMAPGDFIHTFGDVHVYLDQVDEFKKQLDRKPLALPTVEINPDVKDVFSFTMDDVRLVNYQHHEAIKYNVAI
jgi:thymidylate synthase